MIKITPKRICYILCLLSVLLIANSLIARFSQSGRELQSVARNSETKIQDQMAFINEFYDHNVSGKDLSDPGLNTSGIIEQLDNANLILLQYCGDELVFWSSNHVLPDSPVEILNGNSLFESKTGWYITNKREVNGISNIFLTLLRCDSTFPSNFITPCFASSLNIPAYFKLGVIGAPNTATIHDGSGDALFALRIDGVEKMDHVSFLKIFIEGSILTIISWVLLAISNHLWLSRRRKTAFLFLITTSLLFRWLMLSLKSPETIYNTPLFKPEVFQSSYPNSSLGDLLLNVLVVLGIIWACRKRLRPIDLSFKKKPLAVLLSLLFLGAVYGLCRFQYSLLEDLVIHSNIKLNLSQVLSLDGYSLTCIIIISLSLSAFYLFCSTCLRFFSAFQLSLREKIAFLVIVFTSLSIYFSATGQLNYYYLLIIWLLLLIEQTGPSFGKRLVELPKAALIIITCSALTALSLNDLQNVRSNNAQLVLAQKLSTVKDPITGAVLANQLRKLKSDPVVLEYFLSENRNTDLLAEYIREMYFSEYFSEYSISLFPFTSTSDTATQLLTKSIPTLNLPPGFMNGKSDSTLLLLRLPGYHHYIVNVGIRGTKEASLLINLHSKPGEIPQRTSAMSHPDLLLFDEELNDYSFAAYHNDQLFSFRGSYPYQTSGTEFRNKLHDADHTFFNTTQYRHLISQIAPNTFIVITQNKTSTFAKLAIFSYLLIFSIAASIVLILIRLFIRFIYRASIQKARFDLYTLFVPFNLLFKTKVQLSMVLTVMASVVVIGLMTISNVQKQYQEQQQQLIIDRVNLAVITFKSQLMPNNNLQLSDEFKGKFASYAGMSNSSLILYDADGIMVHSSLPNQFKQLITSRINPKPFYEIKRNGYTEHLSLEESIGDLHYISAYAPITGRYNEILGYLNIPYFENTEEYRSKVSTFLNSMINVYALVFLCIGGIAFFVAKSITEPLAMLAQNFRTTRIGRNTPIEWNRKDEIGLMVDEYNNMIYELGISTSKLASSERENAWKEVAKQVAHEISNPLTPLRLGLQHLERSKKDNDPNFDTKFTTFCSSFLQQIDSLAFIAAEFSNFAKMPETRNEVLDVRSLLEQTVTIFKETDQAEVCFRAWDLTNTNVFADKDQLLRAFNNLVKNALQSLPTERPGMVNIDLTSSENEVVITVSDTGIGIDEELKEKIFVPNFTTKSSGSGIGLTLVKNSIENAGGKVRFSSMLGVGTTFYINLPVVKPMIN